MECTKERLKCRAAPCRSSSIERRGGTQFFFHMFLAPPPRIGAGVDAKLLEAFLGLFYEMHFSDVLDYVKTGVAAIIEDEVTQR